MGPPTLTQCCISTFRVGVLVGNRQEGAAFVVLEIHETRFSLVTNIWLPSES